MALRPGNAQETTIMARPRMVSDGRYADDCSQIPRIVEVNTNSICSFPEIHKTV